SPRIVVAASLAAFMSSGTAIVFAATSTSLPKAVEERIRAGLDDLHDGLYGPAEEAFRAASQSAPGDPQPALFVAFAYWWRIIQDRSAPSLEAPFLAAITSAVAAGESRLESAPEDPRILSCVGLSHLLRAQVEAMHRNLFKASQEARRGKKRLDAVLKIDP